MKHVKLFEAFVNEGKVDPQTFTDEVVNMRSQIEEDADYAEMSDGNMAYFLDEAWEVVMEQINFHDQYHTLNQAFIKAKVKIDDDFHGVNMKRDAIEFAKMAYDLTNYSYTGAVECFMTAIKDTMSLSNSQVRSIEKYLNNAIDESVVNEAARLRSSRDWEGDIADEVNADGDEIVDDIDDGYFKATYDGDTGFDIVVYNHRDKEIGDGFVDCDGYGAGEILDAIYNEVRDLSESVVNEKLSKSELNKIEDFLYNQDADTLREICDELLADDEDYAEDKYDLDSDDLVRMAMDYIDGESIKLKDVKAMV